MARLLIKAFAAAAVVGLVACNQPAVAPAGGGDDGGDGVSYTVKFELRGGNPPAPPSQVIYQNEPRAAIAPADPVKKGNVFRGWFTSDAGAEALDNASLYDFAQIVSKSWTLYAGWMEVAGSFEVSNVGEWNAAVTEINKTNGPDGGVEKYAITVKEDITIDPSVGPTFTTKRIHVVVQGKDAGRTLALRSGGGALFSVEADQTIEAGKIQLKGPSAGGGKNTGPLIDVDGGAFILGAEAVVSRIDNSSNAGGGAYVHGEGTLTLDGGAITGAKVSGSGGCGGGAYVDGSTLSLKNGASISGNTATNGGGLYVTGKSTIDVSSGHIDGNFGNYAIYINGAADADNAPSVTITNGSTVSDHKNLAGTAAYYAILVNTNTTLVMEDSVMDKSDIQINFNGYPSTVTLKRNKFTNAGSTVLSNAAGPMTLTMEENEISGMTKNYGIHAKGGTITLKGDKFYNNKNIVSVIYTTPTDAGKVQNPGTAITMENCEIYDNTLLTTNKCSCIYLSTLTTLTMSGGRIEGNNFNGAYVTGAGAEFTMKDGAKIINNNAAETAGGRGVYVDAGAKFTLVDGEISGHKRSVTEVHGVGLYAKGAGTVVEMRGGKIAGNETTKGNGTGVCIQDGVVFTMSGGAIEGNKNASTANPAGGAGLYISDSTFTMEGEARIRDNLMTGTTTARQGAGLYVSAGSGKKALVNLKGGEIFGNRGATHGGGIYMTGATATVMLTGTGAKISGNGGSADEEKPDAIATEGGGVCVVASGVFRMMDGTVHGSDAREGLENVATSNAAVKGTINLGTYDGTDWSPEDPATAVGGDKTVLVRDGIVQTYVPETHDPVGGGEEPTEQEPTGEVPLGKRA